ncbi:MAG TPA: DUF5615 family PIN-like protein [Thermoanaerobaculia bacterium]|nr:DUF5615 family PIN-like protein [Thermoanaerobaculia bacterium]
MRGLFVELYLDEDVDVLVAEMVRAYGFVATTTREAGHLGASDADQLAHAASAGKVFVTHNRVDVERLAVDYFSSGREHSGIVFAVRRSPQEIVRRLLLLLNQTTADEMRNQLRYL